MSQVIVPPETIEHLRFVVGKFSEAGCFDQPVDLNDDQQVFDAGFNLMLRVFSHELSKFARERGISVD